MVPHFFGSTATKAFHGGMWECCETSMYQRPPTEECCAVGDTLFALGCGRLFEGNAKQMWASLSKMLPLPRSATVFCAHEYTQVATCPPPVYS